MATSQIQGLAIVLSSIWLLSGLVAFYRQRGPAVAINVIVALIILSFAAPPLLSFALDQEAYIIQFGRAALADLPMTAALLLLSLAAISACIASIHRPFWIFLIGWLANLPAMVLLIFMAFFFRMF